MSVEHKTSEEAIYYEAVAKSPNEREVYLQAACGRDAALLARVQTLLEAREVRDSFLESAPWDPAVVLDTSAVTEGPGTVIGRYKLLEKIGLTLETPSQIGFVSHNRPVPAAGLAGDWLCFARPVLPLHT